MSALHTAEEASFATARRRMDRGAGTVRRALLWIIPLPVAVGAGLMVALSHRYGLALAGGTLVLVLGFIRIEVAYAAFVLAGLVLTDRVGSTAWIALLALTTLLAFLHASLAGRSLVVTTPLALYVVVYLLAGLHAGPGVQLLAMGKYIATPLFAAATAMVCEDRRTRMILLAMVIAACLAQIPVVVVNAGLVVLLHGGVTSLADSVSGLFKDATSLAQLEVDCGLLFVGFAVAGMPRRRLLLLIAGVLFLTPILTVVKVGEFEIPAGLLALTLSALFGTRIPAIRRRVRPLLISAVLVGPVVLAATSILYPGSEANVSNPSQILTYLNGPASGAGSLQGAIPERGVALTTALRLTADANAATALLGRGPGVTNVNLGGRPAVFAQVRDVLLTPQQFTNRIWIGRTLVETGVLGLGAFLVLLAWMSEAARRAVKFLPEGDVELGLLLAMPGIMAVTLIGSFHDTLLSLTPYATVFWTMIGISLASARSVMTRGPSGSPPSLAFWR